MRISDWSSDVCSSDLSGDGAIFSLPGAVSLVAEGGQLFIDANGTRSNGGALAADSWANVALVNDGAKSTLYINGQPDRKSTRLTPVTNAHLVCRLLLEKKNTHSMHNKQKHTNAIIIN